MFTKGAVTRTSSDEPMVQLDAAAITERIGAITPVKRPQPVAVAITTRAPEVEAKWRRALRPRTAA